MKIAFYSPTWPPGQSANGIVTYLSKLVPALRRLNHTVFVITPDPIAEPDRFTVDLRRYAPPPSLWNSVRWRVNPAGTAFNASSTALANAIGSLLAEHAVDVFEMEESFGLSASISTAQRLPVIVRLHGPWFLAGSHKSCTEGGTLNARRVEREGRSIRLANFVTAPSASVLQDVKSYYKLELAMSGVIPNPLEAVSEEEIWNVDACDAKSLLFVGRFDDLKGAPIIVRTFARLAASDPRLELTFVGPDRGVKGDGGTRLSFDEFVHRNVAPSVRNRIKFLGQMHHADVMAMRRKYFITLIASEYESMGYSVLEAMAAGCPLVATAVGGIPELVNDRRNGLLVRAGDAEAMEAACRRLLEDQEYAARLGRQAWNDCRATYDPDFLADQTIAAYSKAIGAFKMTSDGPRP